MDRLLGTIETPPPSDRLILKSLFFVVVFSGIWLLFSLNNAYTATTPVAGGTLREGVVGTPRFVNPALAITRADQDVTALIYSGLMKIDQSGTLVPDLAESVTVSEDGLTYNIVLRENISFHDNTPITAKDVVFTLQLIQNPDLKSPLRGNWTDVTVELISDRELNVVLAEPYAPFIENFLVGIMPQHLWGTLPLEQLPFSQLNTEPVGSGPFMLSKAERDTSGLIQRYVLTAYRQNPTAPKINTFEFHFFNTETDLITALDDNLIDATAYISNQSVEDVVADGQFKSVTEPLPRVFGIFFNQNRSAALRDPAVREALTLSIDRDAIIERALFGFGVPISTPTIHTKSTLESLSSGDTTASSTSLEEAKTILAEAGWLANNRGILEKQIDGNTELLSLTLRTTNVPLFDATMQEVVQQWEAIGVEVQTEQFEQAGLVQSVIRPRDFQALLFGLDMSRSGDLYPFWHSSQKDDPGLNIAQYTNLTVDALLAASRIEQTREKQTETLAEVSSIITEERPAIFLFQPHMVYVVREEIIVPPMNQIGRPADRFTTIADWYTASDELWPLFQ